MIEADKKWLFNELKLRMKGYEEDIKFMEENPDKYDADYIGDSKDMRELNACKFIESMIEKWPEGIRDEMVYEVLETLFCHYPITGLNDISHTEEWTMFGDKVGKNNRYDLFTYDNGRYVDWTRMKVFDLLTNRYIHNTTLEKEFGKDLGTKIHVNLFNFLNDHYPITCPYYPQSNKFTMYCEIINEEDIKTIAICHVHDPVHEKYPTRILRYFDICESGSFDEIDQSTYVNERRKKYEERHAVEDVTDDSDSH